MLAPSKRVSLAIFLLVFVTYAYFFQGGFANQNTRYNFALGLAMGHAHSDPFFFNTLDQVRIGEHYYMEKAPLASYLTLPVAWLSMKLVPLERFLRSPEIANWSLYFATLFSVSLVSALSAVFFLRILGRLNPQSSLSLRVLITFATYLATPCFGFSTVLFGHQLAAALLVMAIYFGLKEGERAFLLFNFLLGLMVAAEYPTAPVAGVVWIWRVFSQPVDRRLLSLGLFAGALPLFGIASHNRWLYGTWGSLGYAHMENTPFQDGMSQGAMGISWPKVGVAMELLFGMHRGLFVFAPFLILGVAGCFFWMRSQANRGLGMALMASCVTLLAINSGYYFWESGLTFGPRHLIVGMPLLAMAAVFLPPETWGTLYVRFTLVVSFFLNLMGTATNLFYDDSYFTPIFEYYLPAFFGGKLSAHPMGFLSPWFEMIYNWFRPDEFPWASFNLGELTGLTGLSSLLPLAVVWGIGLFSLRNFLKDSGKFPSVSS